MSFSTITKAASPSPTQFDTAPVPPPAGGTLLISDLQWNNLIDILDGSSVDKIAAGAIAGGVVTNAEYDRLSGVTSPIQTQLDSKLENINGESIDDLSDVTITARAANQLLVVNPGNTAWINAAGVFSAITGVGAQTQILNMGNFAIQSLAAPVGGTDAATKTYVDNLVNGLAWKDSARAATTVNITLSGAQVIDGVSVVAGDRVLVKDQTLGQENGLYDAAAGAWTRTEDADTEADLLNMSVFVQEGTANGATGWTLTTPAPIVVDTTPLVYAQIGAGPGNPLTTKGDLFGRNATEGARVPVGADNTVLIANSAQAVGVEYQLIANANVAAGRFSNITGVSNSLNLLTDDTTAILELEANHTVPGSQTIGQIDFYDDNSVNARTLYAEINVAIVDPTSTSEDATVNFRVLTGGVFQNYMLFNTASSSEIALLKNTNMFGNSIIDAGFISQQSVTFPAGTVSYIARSLSDTRINYVTGGSLEVTANNASPAIFGLGSLNITRASNLAVLDLEGVYGAPTGGEDVGNVDFSANNATPTKIQYGRVGVVIENPAAGLEEGSLFINVMSGGNFDTFMDFNFGSNGLVRFEKPILLQDNIDVNSFTMDNVARINFGPTNSFILENGDIEYNVRSGGFGHEFFVNAISEYKFDATVADFSSNNLLLNGGFIDITEIAAPANPGVNIARMYARDDGGITKLYFRDSAGTETELGGAGGSGDVVGPGSSTDNAIARFDLATGKLIQNSGVIINDTNTITVPGPIVLTAAGTVPAGTETYFREVANDLVVNVNTANSVLLNFGTTNNYTFTQTQADFQGNNLVDAIITSASTLTGTVVSSGLSYNNGIKQTFNPSTSNAGINVGAEISDPSVGVNGDIYYDSVGNKFRVYENGSWIDMIAAAGEVFTWTADHSAARYNLENTGAIDFDLSGPLVTPASTQPYIAYDTVPTPDALRINVPGARTIFFSVGGVDQMEITDAIVDVFGNGIQNANFLEDNSANPANAGVIRLGNNTDIAWRNAGNTNDHTITFNSSDQFVIEITSGNDYVFSETALTANGKDLLSVSAVSFDGAGASIGAATPNIYSTAAGMVFNVTTSDTFVMTFNNSARYTFTTNDVTFLNRDLLQVGNVDFGTGSIPAGASPEMWYDGTTYLGINVPTGDEIRFYINAVEAFSYSATVMDLFGRSIQNAGNINIENITATGPILTLDNTDSSPSIGHLAGTITFRGDRTASSAFDYGKIVVEMLDVTSGSADGEMKLMVGNANTANAEYITLNEASGQTIHFKKDVENFNMENTLGTGDITQLLGLTFNDDATQLSGAVTYVQRSNGSLILNAVTGEDVQVQINNILEMTIASNLITLAAATDLNAGGDVIIGDRLQGQKGPDVASADAITLGDGNYFDITGAVTINHLINTNWQNGSIVTLQFDAAATLTNAAGGATGAEQDFALAGAANFVATAGDTITLVNDGTVWREIARSVN